MEKHITFSLFSENRKIRNNIALVHKNENIISEENLVSEELKNVLENIVKRLQINENSYIIDELSDITVPMISPKHVIN